MTKDKPIMSFTKNRENEISLLKYLLFGEIESILFGFYLRATSLKFKRTPHFHDVVTKVARSYTFIKTDIKLKSLSSFFSFLVRSKDISDLAQL